MALIAVDKLIEAFRKLPGVGEKTAARYAYKIIDMNTLDAESFVDAVISAKREVRFCSVCGGYSENDVCDVCKGRDRSTVCVVKDPRDMLALEKIGGYNGVYHVLHGTLDAVKGIGQDDIRIKELMARLDGVKEVILATNSDISGEFTAGFIANKIKPLGIIVTRLAQGIPMGSEIEYADELTLLRAFGMRTKI